MRSDVVDSRGRRHRSGIRSLNGVAPVTERWLEGDGWRRDASGGGV